MGSARYDLGSFIDLVLVLVLVLLWRQEQAVPEVVCGRTQALRLGMVHAHEPVEQARGARGEVPHEPAAARGQLQGGHEVHSAGRARLEPEHVVA